MKGQTIIELEDIKTHEKERYEDTNMVTNALSKVISYVNMLRGTSVFSEGEADANSIFPARKALLGGLALLDSPITEDVESCLLPFEKEGVSMVGVSGNFVNDSTNVFLGSVNLTETGPVDGGYKWVWDFSTSQCNGDIAAVALTSNTQGHMGPTKQVGRTRNWAMTIDDAIDTKYNNTSDSKSTPVRDVRFVLFPNNLKNTQGLVSLLPGYRTPCISKFINDIDFALKIAHCSYVNIEDGRIYLYTFDLKFDVDSIKLLDIAGITGREIINAVRYDLGADESTNKLAPKYRRNTFDANWWSYDYSIAMDSVSIYVLSGSTSQSKFVLTRINRATKAVTTEEITLESGAKISTSQKSMVLMNSYLYIDTIDKQNSSGNLNQKCVRINCNNFSEVETKTVQFRRTNGTEEDCSTYNHYPENHSLSLLDEKRGIAIFSNFSYIQEGKDNEWGDYFVGYSGGVCHDPKSNDSSYRHTTIAGGGKILDDVLWVTWKSPYYLSDGSYNSATSKIDNSCTLRFGIMAGYMATINNLETPVTKTPDKTMKITYILRES